MLGGASNGETVIEYRKRVPKEKREKMLAAAGFACFYCHCPLPTIDKMRIDHKIPLSRGGPDNDGNRAVSCERCDFIKGNATAEEFKARGLGRDRKRPFGAGKGMPKTMRFLRMRMRAMRPESRTKDILIRVLNGERVDITAYPAYINPRHRYDRLPGKIRSFVRDYDFLKFENGVLWKCK